MSLAKPMLGDNVTATFFGRCSADDVTKTWLPLDLLPTSSTTGLSYRRSTPCELFRSSAGTFDWSCPVYRKRSNAAPLSTVCTLTYLGSLLIGWRYLKLPTDCQWAIHVTLGMCSLSERKDICVAMKAGLPCCSPGQAWWGTK